MRIIRFCDLVGFDGLSVYIKALHADETTRILDDDGDVLAEVGNGEIRYNEATQKKHAERESYEQQR